jgi:hypothetical protein
MNCLSRVVEEHISALYFPTLVCENMEIAFSFPLPILPVIISWKYETSI